MNVRKMLPIAAAFVLGAALSSTVALAKDKQPMMKAAIGNLQDAKRNLNNATSDKGGHRVKALEFIDSAIDQVQKGIDFDNEHEGKGN